MTTVLSVARSGEDIRRGEMVCLASIAFLLPLTLGGPQILVGTLVNAVLIYAALQYRFTRVLPIVVLPSIAVLSRGVMFGALTPVLMVLLPYIWTANVLLVAGIRLANTRGYPVWIALIVSVAAKVGFLFASTALLADSGLVPRAMILAMGQTQLVTALLGALIAALVSSRIGRGTRKG